MNEYEAVAIVLGAIGLVTGLALVWERIFGDPDLEAPWDPHTSGFARCGRRGCANPHPAAAWMERRDR